MFVTSVRKLFLTYLYHGQARLCAGPHALLHLPVSNARRGFPKHGGWRLHTVQTRAGLFNVAHFRTKTKTTRILMREMLFADDSALVAHSAEEIQKIMDAFSDASKKFGLKMFHQEDRVAVPTHLYKNPR